MVPRPPKLQGDFIVADLRNVQDEVGTLDYGDPKRPQWSVGRSVLLADLKIDNLEDRKQVIPRLRGTLVGLSGADAVEDALWELVGAGLAGFAAPDGARAQDDLFA